MDGVHDEWCIGLGLVEQRQVVDDEGRGCQLAEVMLENLRNMFALAPRHRPRQRHVKAEIVEDEGVAPIEQVVELAFAKMLVAAPGEIPIG